MIGMVLIAVFSMFLLRVIMKEKEDNRTIKAVRFAPRPVGCVSLLVSLLTARP
jgi:hypothetical protein